MSLEPRPPAPKFQTFFISRIPKTKKEEQLQFIFSTYYPGAMLHLLDPKRKSRFTTARVTIPHKLANSCPNLIKAAASEDGHPITLAPLPKLYFRPDPALKKSSQKDASRITQLEQQLHSMQVTYDSHIHSLQQQIIQLQYAVHALQQQRSTLVHASTSHPPQSFPHDPRSASRSTKTLPSISSLQLQPRLDFGGILIP